MSLTLGLTGMDPDTETALTAAFSAANSGLNESWKLVPEAEAAFVVVDMDTLYGPMSWLRLHAAEKTVIGLTTAPRTQTDFRLERPFTADSLRAMLSEIATSLGFSTIAPAPAAEPPAEPAPAARPLADESESVEVTSLARFADLADSLPSPPAAAAANLTEPAAAGDAQAAPAAVMDVAAEPAAVAPATAPAEVARASSPAETRPEPAAPPAPAPAPPRQATLATWLGEGKLTGRSRVQHGPATLWLDMDHHSYFGPTSLKPLADLFAMPLEREAVQPVDEATWSAGTEGLGAAQPLARLLWLGGLLAGNGELAAGLDPNDRYRLLKWPQTEREYPKHFRIATVMMKGPATLAEIAEASGVTRQEVNDFVNANLATGFAEPFREPEPEPESSKAGGLFGRLRGR